MQLSKQLDYLDELEIELSELVISGSKDVPVEELAKVAGKSVSLVYKAASINDDNPFPAVWLPAFMNIKSNYKPLISMCRLTGHLPPVKEMAFKLLKGDETTISKKFTRITHRVSESFEDHLENPTKESYKEFKKTAEETIKQLLAAINYAEKALVKQGELEL